MARRKCVYIGTAALNGNDVQILLCSLVLFYSRLFSGRLCHFLLPSFPFSVSIYGCVRNVVVVFANLFSIEK